MPNNKELFEQKMDALANSINTKANSSGAKTIDQLKTAIDSIVTDGYIISANTYGDTIDILGSVIYSITASITNGTASGDTTILPNGTATITITANSGYSLPEVSDIVVTNATKGTFTEGVLTISNPTGNVTISASCVKGPGKGDILLIDMIGSGTPQEYRVIRMANKQVVEVMAMTNATTSAFASSDNIYENSSLDTYLNTTWYNTLSNTAKSAIVDNTFRQDSWYWNKSGNPDYEAKSSGDVSYQLSLSNNSFGNEITRHCYALSVQDIIDYLEVTPEMTQSNTTLTYTNICQMFWKRDTATSEYNIWLRSAVAKSGLVFIVKSFYGSLMSDLISGGYAVRPAFLIDLSKITWTPSN